MKLKLLSAVAMAAMIMVPSVAQADDGHADDHEGWYLRGNVGYGIHTDTDFSRDLIGDVESEGNVAGSLGVGYDFGSHWRVELDGSTLWTDLGQIAQAPSSFAKVRTSGVFVNALYDFDEFGNFEPYVGAGVGVVLADLDAQSHGFFGSQGVVINNPTCTGFACRFSNRDAGLGVQLLAGLGYDISDRVTWDTHYRFQKFSDFDFEGDLQQAARGGFTAGLTEIDDFGAHMLMTGLRYRFGGTPAPMATCWNGDQVKMLADCPAQPMMVTCWDGSSFEKGTGECPVQPRTISCWDGSSYLEGSGGTCPPEPVPVQTTVVCWDNSVVSDASLCPAQPTTRSGQTVTSLCANEYRQEIIYYEFDRGQSAETRATINRILDIGEFCQVSNIRVVGHTDTSGGAAYNQQLSERRAKDAADELVRQGINQAVISSSGMGETQPFVDTGDGVKEQLNRRTEVLIQLTQAGAINFN